MKSLSVCASKRWDLYVGFRWMKFLFGLFLLMSLAFLFDAVQQSSGILGRQAPTHQKVPQRWRFNQSPNHCLL
jgi:hypothetical protein